MATSTAAASHSFRRASRKRNKKKKNASAKRTAVTRSPRLLAAANRTPKSVWGLTAVF